MFDTAQPRVVHLIDDTTAGGVMRVLDHLTGSPKLAEHACHKMLKVARGKISLRRIRADIIVSHLSISWRTLPVLIALRARHPFAKIVHVEHSYTAAFVAHNVERTARFYTLLRAAFSLFDRVVAVSKGQANWLGKQGLVSEDKLQVIQSYVDLQSFEGIPDRTGPIRIFGAIGRFDRQKGFDVLIKAFRKTTDPDLRLYFFGEGAEEAALRTLAKGDTRIQFKGFASDPLDAYRMVDAVVMPSRWEAYGLVAIEALSARRVLICNACDGLQDHSVFGAHILTDDTVDTLVDSLQEQGNDPSPRNGRSITHVLGANNMEDWRRLVGQLVE
jgi:glycosyltransferase involved in cell wall biosynthesis